MNWGEVVHNDSRHGAGQGHMEPIYSPPYSFTQKLFSKPYYVPRLAVLDAGNPAVDMTSKFPALMGLTFWEEIENKEINV